MNWTSEFFSEHLTQRRDIHHRLRQEILQLRVLVLKLLQPLGLPLMPNHRWAPDFVSDQLTDSRRFRVLTVVDDCTRESLALIADNSLSGARVAREPAALFEARGKPGTVVSDNGTEFASNAILTFVDERKIDWHYIAPGKPTHNASS